MQHHIQTMYNEVIKIANKVELYHQERPDASNAYTSEAFGRWDREENEKLREAKKASMGVIQAAAVELIALIEGAAIARGTDLTDDAKLFTTPGLELTAADLEFLGEKYRENPTMARLIASYAREHQIGGARIPKTAVQKVDAVNNIVGQIGGVFFSGSDTFGMMCRQLVEHWDGFFGPQIETIGDPK